MDDFVTILSSKIDELNLKAPVSGPCEGYILESRSTMAGKGRPATVLVKRGTLNKKDLLIAGETLCKGTALTLPSVSPHIGLILKGCLRTIFE